MKRAAIALAILLMSNSTQAAQVLLEPVDGTGDYMTGWGDTLNSMLTELYNRGVGEIVIGTANGLYVDSETGYLGLSPATNNSPGAATPEQIQSIEEVAAKLQEGSDGTYGVSIKSNTSTFSPDSGYDSGFSVIANLPYVYHNSTNYRLIEAGTIPYHECFSILTPADADDVNVWEWSSTTTLTSLTCVALGGGTISIDLHETDSNGANGASMGLTSTCGSTKSTDNAPTDSSAASGNYARIVFGAPSGTVDEVTICINGVQSW